MWFSFTRKVRRTTPLTSKPPGSLRPRVEALEDRCLLSAGALDTSFGTGGKVIMANVTNGTQDMLVQPDGKIVIGSAVNGQFELLRFNADGKSLDSTFGSGGKVLTTVGVATGGSKGTPGGSIDGLALQSDGKIVAVGTAIYATTRGKGLTYYNDRAFATARYNSNGSLDTTFGSGGITLTNLVTVSQAAEGASAVTFDAAGNIIVKGYVQYNPSTGIYGTSLIRLKPTGALDASFGNAGIVTVSQTLSGNTSGSGIAVQADGKIVLILGGGSAGMTLTRYLPGGQVDPSFGASGIVSVLGPSGFARAYARDVIVESNGSLLVAGLYFTSDDSTHYQVVARLSANGQLDTSFGESGLAVNTDLGSASGIAKAANGDIIAAGGALGNSGTSDFGVAAFLPSGSLDASFGNNGTSLVDILGGQDYAASMCLQGDGKILVAGHTESPGYYLAIVRFQAPNTKITSFTATPNPVAAGSPLTLSASGILNSNPTTTITQVAFYLDDGSGNLEPGADTLLGTGTNVNGMWSFSFTPTTSGTFTLFAVAIDSAGIWSDPVAVVLTVV